MTIASAVKRNKDARPKPHPKVVEVVQTDFDPTLDDESESDDDGKSTFFHSISACDVFFFFLLWTTTEFASKDHEELETTTVQNALAALQSTKWLNLTCEFMLLATFSWCVYDMLVETDCRIGKGELAPVIQELFENRMCIVVNCTSEHMATHIDCTKLISQIHKQATRCPRKTLSLCANTLDTAKR